MHKREVISTVINYDASGSKDILVVTGEEKLVIPAGEVSGDGKVTKAFTYKKLGWQMEVSADFGQ